jgi:hypothetical protein
LYKAGSCIGHRRIDPASHDERYSKTLLILTSRVHLPHFTAMPFNFDEYDAECSQMSLEELQREWNHYTRLITGSATSTTISSLAVPFTFGISGIGVLIGGAGIHNARKKRDIIDRHLCRYQEQHRTRKRDVMGSAMFSGAVGIATLGVGGWGAEVLLAEGIQHGVVTVADDLAVKAVAHVAADGAGLGAEHMHHNSLKDEEKKHA